MICPPHGINVVSRKHTVAAEFENRICVFLDILGFRDHIDRAVADPAHVKRISGAFACVGEHLKTGIDRLASRRISQYSDCVTVSYKVTESSSAWTLLTDLQYLQIALVERGFLVRGGVSVGQLVHDESQLFGPAQVKAYELESKEAIYPRILVDKSVIKFGRQNPAPHHDGDDEEGYLRRLVSKDFDGRLYIGYTTWDSIVDVAGADSEDYPDYMRKVLKIVETGLQSKDPCTLAKTLWLYGKFLDAREDIKEELRDSHFPDPLLASAQSAYQAVVAHMKATPRDATKCALPAALIGVLTSN